MCNNLFFLQDVRAHLPVVSEVEPTGHYFRLTEVINQADELRLIDISFYRADVIGMPLDSVKPLGRNVLNQLFENIAVKLRKC